MRFLSGPQLWLQPHLPRHVEVMVVVEAAGMAVGMAATAMAEVMVGDTASAGDWSTLFRHLSFGEAVDLRDIAERDWPSIRAATPSMKRTSRP